MNATSMSVGRLSLASEPMTLSGRAGALMQPGNAGAFTRGIAILSFIDGPDPFADDAARVSH